MGYAINSTNTGWRAVNSEADLLPGETYSETQPAPFELSANAELKIAAQTALAASDMVAVRCFKADVPFPVAWQTYVADLRAIINGTDTTSTTLPAAPVYPSGT